MYASTQRGLITNLGEYALDVRPTDAARLVGAGGALRERLGTSLSQVDPMTLAQAVRGVRASLGESEYAAIFEAGRRLSPADVMQAHAS